MKNFLIFVLVFSMCVAVPACAVPPKENRLEFDPGKQDETVSESVQPSPPDETVESVENVPDKKRETPLDSGVVWCGSLVVTLENAEMISKITPESYEVYTDPGDMVRASIFAKNGLNVTQSFHLMVFADGVPIEFTVDGTAYTSYPLDLSPEEKLFEIEFQKEFALDLGRLDFVMTLSSNPWFVYSIMSCTIWIELDKQPAQPPVLYSTVEQREGVRNCYSGYTYGSWVWNKGVILAETTAQANQSIHLLKDETVLLEAIAAKPGLYRTVLVLNDTPVAFQINGQKTLYIDWESNGSNMLQLPITIADLTSDGYLYTITTPLSPDTRAQQILASSITELDLVEKQ